jgi:hypothetical protein
MSTFRYRDPTGGIVTMQTDCTLVQAIKYLCKQKLALTGKAVNTEVGLVHITKALQ